MGGFNSGRYGGKRTTADMRALDIRKIQREGLLNPGRAFGWSWTRGGETIASINLAVNLRCATLQYRSPQHGGQWEDMKYTVRLTYTACRYGGQRAWWLCPAVGCGRRVAVLYGGAVFACRQCQRLAYKSQREAPHDRASRRADKLRDRLGWEAGILNGEGCKPKGMLWQTYERLTAIHNRYAHQSLTGMNEKLALAMARLGNINLKVKKLGF